MEKSSRTKALIILGIVSCMVLVGLMVSDVLGKRGKSSIMVNVSPTDSVVTMDGKKIHSGKNYVKAGVHVFAAKRSGFKDTNVNKTNIEDNEVVILILPTANEEGKRFLESNPKEQSIRESLGGALANQQGQETITKTPLIQYLPFIDREYRIDYGPSQKKPNDSTAVAITITYSTDASKQDALDWIKFKGSDPSQLEIIFTRFPGF